MPMPMIARAAAGATLLVTLLLAGCGSEPDPLAEHGLASMDAVDIVDHLDRLGGAARPADLIASVRPDALVVASDEGERTLDLPADRFYLSVAPYVERTHDCFHHSLTTCQGELVSEEVRVRVVDETHGTVLVDETRTTFANGFTGFWLPRDIEGTVRVAHEGRSGQVPFATDDDAPTCLTTLRLA